MLFRSSRVDVENISINRSGVTFTAEGSNLFGKIFFLNTEFVEMLNSLPFFKDGVIKSFSRKKSKSGEDSMSFSLQLKMQGSDEIDPADARFSEYLQGIEAVRKASGPKIRIK